MRIFLFLWNLYLKIIFNIRVAINPNKIKYYRSWSKVKPNWNLSFSDEFDKYKLNRDYWRTDTYYNMRFHPGNIIDTNSAPDIYLNDNCYSFDSTTIKLKNISLPIDIDYEGFNYKVPYQVGHIDSSNYFMQSEGYFEIRACAPNIKGLTSRVSLESIFDWPPSIDILNINNNILKHIINYRKWGKNRKKSNSFNTFDLSKGYFTYGLEWNSKYLKFYFQNELIYVSKTPSSLIHPMHLVIGCEIDSTKTDSSLFPNQFSVDYVRAYTKKDI